MQFHVLSLAISKTEIVFLSKRRIPPALSLQIDNVQLEAKPATKYLRVMIDSKLLFGEQAHVLEKHVYQFSRVQRRVTLRVAPDPVSEPDVMVIAGVFSIFHFAMDRQATYLWRTEFKVGKVASSACLFCPDTADTEQHTACAAVFPLLRSASRSLSRTSLELCSRERIPGTV
ncbi:hypothetical protein J6590_085031 [Homalodisca vitripennis]|nr:hypothetical protein J6590_085031 [Homalodisca vitripennis]